MGYVPDLIPEDKKVLPEYFRSNSLFYPKQNTLVTILGYIGASFFWLSGIVFISHPIIIALFGVVGFMLFPPGHNFIERAFQFRLTKVIKFCICTVLVILTLPLMEPIQTTKKEVVEQKVDYGKKVAAEKLLLQQALDAHRDSFKKKNEHIRNLTINGKLDEGLRAIDSALHNSPTGEETVELQNQLNLIRRIKANSLTKSGNYKEALPILTKLLLIYPSDPELLFNRGICYAKTNRIPEAVGDLKRAMDQGNEGARKLYEKINPIRKRIVGYTTLCCDGTTSSARGRGACSRHGGVCDWNHPIYEEYRKYE